MHNSWHTFFFQEGSLPVNEHGKWLVINMKESLEICWLLIYCGEYVYLL